MPPPLFAKERQRGKSVQRVAQENQDALRVDMNRQLVALLCAGRRPDPELHGRCSEGGSTMACAEGNAPSGSPLCQVRR